MPTPPLSDETLIETLKVIQELGRKGACQKLNISDSTIGHRKKLAEARGLHMSEGAQDALRNTQLSGSEVRMGWKRVKNEEGGFDSVMWKAPEASPVDLAKELSGMFANVRPVSASEAPALTDNALCTLYPLFDVHWGMRAWGAETGGADYDLPHAAADMRDGFAKVMSITPNSKEAILLIGGDFFHADDHNAETPASKHKLDVDSRHFKVLDEGVTVIVSAISWLLEKHEKVTVRVMRGNHDENSYMVLTFALYHRYLNEPRLVIEKEARDLFMFQWGRSGLFAQHGDKVKAETLALAIADTCPFWSDVRYRYCFTGHVHHQQVKDYGALIMETLRPFCPPDAYGSRYPSRRALSSMTFHREDGLVLRATDPIRRSVA